MHGLNNLSLSADPNIFTSAVNPINWIRKTWVHSLIRWHHSSIISFSSDGDNGLYLHMQFRMKWEYWIWIFSQWIESFFLSSLRKRFAYNLLSHYSAAEKKMSIKIQVSIYLVCNGAIRTAKLLCNNGRLTNFIFKQS